MARLCHLLHRVQHSTRHRHRRHCITISLGQDVYLSGCFPCSRCQKPCSAHFAVRDCLSFCCPPQQKFIDCSLHSILTQCAWRHGIFHVGAADLDTQALADYISQPDTTLNDQPSVFTSESWLYTHQITSFGRWDPLPLCLCLSQGTLVSYFCLSSQPNTFPRRIRQRSRPPPLNGKG